MLYSKNNEPNKRDCSLPSDWDEICLAEIGKIITGKTPSTFEQDNFGNEFPFITPRDMTGQKYIYFTERYLSKKGMDAVKNCLLPSNAICVSCIGSDMGKIVMTTRNSITNQQINSIVSAKLPSDYIYYALLKLSPQIKNLGKQSTAIPILNKTQFSGLKIMVPKKLGEANAIAKILSDLDAKIELNRQMNKTLEETAQAIFKHWFVDFEFPDANGKPYKSSGGKMVYSKELEKEIPEGWKVGTLEDLAQITMGQSPPGETYNELGDGIPFYQGITDFGFRFPKRRVYCTSPTRIAEKDDVLLSVRAPVGSLNVANEPCAVGRGVAAIRSKDGLNSYLYHLMRATKRGWEMFDAEGTVFGSVNGKNVREFKILISTMRVLEKFNSLAASFDEKIMLNERQIDDLSSIRDSLLPKLMSGKIRVEDS
ncbi:MAG: restriction endonuclease subunit S [Candidatus Micrarchaeia archaeon]